MKLRTIRAWAGPIAAFVVVGAVASAQVTWRESVDSAGAQGDGSSFEPSLSADGRYVAFISSSSNLVAGDTNSAYDVFVRDTLTGAIERVSVASNGTEADNYSWFARISADGRFVAFQSFADNLVAGDTNFVGDVFEYDRLTKAIERVSVDSSGTQANSSSGDGSLGLSADGRYVVFTSGASNLVAGDTNGAGDVFVHDRTTGTTERVSVDSAGVQANSYSGEPSISADGHFVEFISIASNLAAGDTNGWYDAFVHDRTTGTTTCISLDANGVIGTRGVQDEQTALSADGRFAVFTSLSALIASDTNGNADVFVRDLQSGTTERVDVDSSGAQTVGNSSGGGSISADGRFVAFYSRATNLVANDTNNRTDTFLHDRQTGKTVRVSVDSSGAQQNQSSSDTGYHLALSSDGRFTAFSSFATNLVPGDTNSRDDVFVHGAPLTLEADPAVVTAGSTLTFTAWTGQVSGAALLVVVDVDGSPLFLPVVFGVFDAQGIWSLGATVPTGLAGHALTFLEFGITPTGKVGVSDAASVSFQ